MEGIQQDIIAILYQLLPGFLAAWVFFGLTPHRKGAPFERIVEALIFTVVIRGLNVIVRATTLCLGRLHSLGPWSADCELISSLLLAVFVGLLFARLANSNELHEWLRAWPWFDTLRSKKAFRWLPTWRWTCKTSSPSEWYGAFSTMPRWIILHLEGGRRLHGWPKLFPDHPDSGQFVMLYPQWLLDNGGIAPLYRVEALLVPAAQVEMVEFLKDDSEVMVSEAVMLETQNLLISAQRKEGPNGPGISARTAQFEGTDKAGSEPCALPDAGDGHTDRFKGRTQPATQEHRRPGEERRPETTAIATSTTEEVATNDDRQRMQ